MLIIALTQWSADSDPKELYLFSLWTTTSLVYKTCGGDTYDMRLNLFYIVHQKKTSASSSS